VKVRIKIVGMMELLLLGGALALNALAIMGAPRPIALGERITDTRRFTIRLRIVEPEVKIIDLVAPEELVAGEVPHVEVTVEHTRTKPEWAFARIRDVDTGELVTTTAKHYFWAKGTHTFVFTGYPPPIGRWKRKMPARDWNLEVEVGLWWL